MHSRLNRPTFASSALAFIGALLAVVMLASPAAAEAGKGYHGASADRSGFSVWGLLDEVSSSKSSGGHKGVKDAVEKVQTCPNRWDPEAPAHYETVPGEPGTETLYLLCVNDGHTYGEPGLTNVQWDLVSVIDGNLDPVGVAGGSPIAGGLHVKPRVPSVHSSPPERGDSLVGLDTWFWLEGDPAPQRTTREPAPGISVTLVVSAVDVTFDTGDGETLRCTPRFDASAPPEPPIGCRHQYQRSSIGQGPFGSDEFIVIAHISYMAHYTIVINGETQEGDLGPVEQPSRPMPLRVAEGQAIVTQRRGS
ncbi:MAG: hypothetical protein ABIV94_09990 [Acidimicrobiales bacterium]